jgi:hypothetical protein
MELPRVIELLIGPLQDKTRHSTNGGKMWKRVLGQAQKELCQSAFCWPWKITTLCTPRGEPEGRRHSCRAPIASLVLGNDLPTFPDVSSKTRRLKTSSTNRSLPSPERVFQHFAFKYPG